MLEISYSTRIEWEKQWDFKQFKLVVETRPCVCLLNETLAEMQHKFWDFLGLPCRMVGSHHKRV